MHKKTVTQELISPYPNSQQLMMAKSRFTSHHELKDLHFTRVETENEYQKVKDLRIHVYGKNVPYMLTQISETGSDEFDHRSYIYAAYLGDTVIASARLTPHPFETAHYVKENQLSPFLGNDWKNDYLEWSRLLVDTSFKVPGIAHALTVYAGLDILLSTKYTLYFGYTRPHVRRIFSKFKLINETLSFTIPDRGDHQYLLLKGNFVHDFNHFYRQLEKSL